MIAENLTQFEGAPVRDFDPAEGIVDPTGVAYRVRLDYDDFDSGTRLSDVLQGLLEDRKAPELKRLVIGVWDFDSTNNAAPIVQALAEAGESVRSLQALFFGDIISEEQEISWIQQSSLTPLFSALPNLVSLTIRGGEGLGLDHARHDRLEKLVIQSGGLGPGVINAVVEAKLPRLKHLELWLGDSNYGYRPGSIDLLAPILAGERFPRLEYLGLRNCEEQDQIAMLIAEAPIVDRLDVLDLSLGNLSDEGAEKLAGSLKLGTLKRLDLHHHYVSDAVAEKLSGLGIDVDLSNVQAPDEYDGETFRYIAVSE